MIALTRIDRKSYKGLLKDARTPMEENQSKYGAGFLLRLPGIVCALAVHDYAGDNKHLKTADDLFDAIIAAGFVEDTFTYNGLEKYMPGRPLLEPMIYSMCQAQTGDYGESEEDE